MSRNKRKNKEKILGAIITFVIIGIGAFFGNDILNQEVEKNIVATSSNVNTTTNTNINIDIKDIPEYNGKIYIEINNNIPYFTKEDYTINTFENYSNLDSLGRCGVAFANICKDTMPKEGEERESISNIKPTGWVQKKYDDQYLYNRCHLIGYQLSSENDNELNLITGTRYFNVEGMLPFENMVADYINENENNHVLYRVTPIFENDNLLAKGVEIEAYSVEDNGKGVSFNVFVYNIEPGINIDYKTGESSKIN